MRSLGPLARVGLVALGTISLGAGIAGLFVPILPTTPLLLVAAGCYVRSSERLFNWLIHHPRLGPPVRRYVAQKAIPLKVKVISLIVAWIALGTAFFLIDSIWVKGVLVALAIVKTAFMIRVKTLGDAG